MFYNQNLAQINMIESANENLKTYCIWQDLSWGVFWHPHTLPYALAYAPEVDKSAISTRSARIGHDFCL